MGGAQIASGAVATFMGAPQIGVPLMLGGIKSETNPNPNQGPLQSGISGLMSAGGAAMGGMGSAVTPAAGGIDPSSLGDMMGSMSPGAFDPSTLAVASGGAVPSPMSGMGNFNPAMLSQLMGGANQGMQTPKPQQPPQAPPPVMPRPPANIQQAQQQMSMPQAKPAPQVPKPPQMAGQPSIQAILQKLLGGSM